LIGKARDILRLDFDVQKEKAKSRIVHNFVSNEQLSLEKKVKQFNGDKNSQRYNQELYELCLNRF
jgi:predicted Ser/Thr protein kinase